MARTSSFIHVHHLIRQLIRQNNELQQKVNELQHLVEANQVDQMNAMGVIENLRTDKEKEYKKNAKSDDEKIHELRKNYEAEIKHLQNELSNAISEKIAFEETRQNYVDELDCLKVNLVATEELYKNATAELMVLKSQNATLKQEITANENELKAKQEEVDVVKVQVSNFLATFSCMSHPL